MSKKKTRKARLYFKIHTFFLQKYRDAAKVFIKADKLSTPKGGVIVTEHALLRYAERKYGFDAEQAKIELTGENLAKRIAKLGDGIYPVNDFSVVVQNARVVTVYPHAGNNIWNKAKPRKKL